MGGKKKSLANKLAKMSDEERARYLQHKADMEEEAKRRKEQLISTFLRKKIKKEDAFSRLNIAKINQHWHHILRIRKCDEMKHDVMILRTWIEETIESKNNKINNLLRELNEAEFQYSFNFQSHSLHIDKIIALHQEFIKKLQSMHEQDVEYLVSIFKEENKKFHKNAEDSITHLKSIIFGQEEKTKKEMNQRMEVFQKKHDELISTNHLDYERMRKANEAKISAIWRSMAAIFEGYVKRTDNRRAHFAELKRLDAENAAEIEQNQWRIERLQDDINNLNLKKSSLEERTENTLGILKEELGKSTDVLKNLKKQLQLDIKKDEDKLQNLASNSDNSINFLTAIAVKGDKILNLFQNCRKFEDVNDRFCSMLFPDDFEGKQSESTVTSKVGVSGYFEEQVDLAKCLGKITWTIGRVKVNFLDLRKEKSDLLRSNEELKMRMKIILDSEVSPPSFKKHYQQNFSVRSISSNDLRVC